MRTRWFFLGAIVALSGVVACELAFPTHEADDGTGGGDGGVGGGGDGGVSACPSTCPAPGTTLVSCTGAKSPCALGCTDDPKLGARCRELAPSGVAQPSDYTEATNDVTWGPDAGIVIDTGSGGITSGATTIRAPGTGLDAPSGITFRIAAQLDDSRLGAASPALGVFGFRSLKVAAGTTVRVIGTRAAALLTEGDLVVEGMITARATCDAGVPVAGGYASAAGPRPGASGPPYACGVNNTRTCYAGGGGAGFGTAGGDSDTRNAAKGGAAFPPLDGGTFTLFGGSGGGAGGEDQSKGPGSGAVPGGVGGGALQFGANGSFVLSGVLDACGCGGRGGAGGGAGGMIVIEAPSVKLAPTAIIAANGGGGGAFSNNPVDGLLSGAQAIPSNGGGRGGALSGAAGPGGNSQSTGGGGSVGRVVLNSLSTAPLPDSGVLSPAPALGLVTGK